VGPLGGGRQERLGRLQRELGITHLFITHDLATARAIADDVVVFRKGRVVRQGGKDDVLSAPYDPYTELLISSVPEIDPDWLDRTLAIGDAPGCQDALSMA
jgi:peptide/nickel transport system ATP-binding protein